MSLVKFQFGISYANDLFLFGLFWFALVSWAKIYEDIKSHLWS